MPSVELVSAAIHNYIRFVHHNDAVQNHQISTAAHVMCVNNPRVASTITGLMWESPHRLPNPALTAVLDTELNQQLYWEIFGFVQPDDLAAPDWDGIPSDDDL